MKKIILTLLIATLLTSCDDQLDRAPVDALINSTAFETVDDIEAAVNGIYTNYDPNNVLDINEIFTDNCRLGKDSG